jgi:hypothetical protein
VQGAFNGTWTGPMNYDIPQLGPGCGPGLVNGLTTSLTLTQHANGCIDGVWYPPAPNPAGGIPGQPTALSGSTSGSSASLTSGSYGCGQAPQPLGFQINTASSQSMTVTLTGYGCSGCSGSTPADEPISGTFTLIQQSSVVDADAGTCVP